MNDTSDLIRCDRAASDGTPGAPEVRCPNTTTADRMDGWLNRNYGDFRKTYCPDCAKWHSDLCEPRCEWPGCDVHYRPFVASDVPKGRDLLEDGWLVGYVDGDLTCCPKHAEEGEVRNVEIQAARVRYSQMLSARVIDLAATDPQMRALVDEIQRAGIHGVRIGLALRLNAAYLEAS